MPKRSETRARNYTVEELKRLGWNTKHPNRGGHILEENEIFNFDERFKELLQLDKPDYLIFKNNKPIAIIECKSDKTKFDEAVKDLKYYANKLNKKYFKINFLIAVSGSKEEGVIVRNYYFNGNQWEEIKANNYPLTQIIKPDQIDSVDQNKKATVDIPVPSENDFYQIAEKINSIFHEAKVNKSDRAAYLGSIVLALSHGNIDTRPSVILRQINANVEAALEKHGKKELLNIFKLRGNSDKLKRKLPLIFHNLDKINIRALMNTDADILGKFFETFLRYGNDAKELGIVFTPRHIVNFMIDLIDLKATDTVYDPTCGTGGFLVSAFMRMKKLAGNNTALLKQIKKNRILGVDSEESGKIPALASINMIFRGDGRSNIFNESCFTTKKFDKFKINKILLNPPYAQEDEKETDFIDHSLNIIEKGGLFCSVFTYAVLAEKSSAKWRKNLLMNHTVEAVFSMPVDLFYPTSANTVVMLIKAKIPHKGKIFFSKIVNDGYKIYRKKRVETEGSQLEPSLKLFNQRLIDGNSVNFRKFSIYTELDEDDKLCELVPEAYLESENLTKDIITEKTEKLLLEYGGFRIRFAKELENIEKNEK